MPAPGASTSGQEETTSTALDPPEPIVDVEEAEPEVEEESEPARKDAMTQCFIAIGMVWNVSKYGNPDNNVHDFLYGS